MTTPVIGYAHEGPTLSAEYQAPDGPGKAEIGYHLRMAAALTLGFEEIGPDDLARVGGKGQNLAALTRAGVNVPEGFCVPTAAYDGFLAQLPDAQTHFAALD